MEGESSQRIRKTRIRKVGPYLLMKPIGKGSFSTVYEGKVENSVKKVAIKVISLGNVRKKDYERVQMQIKILSLIKHENIVQLLDFKKSARHLYLIFQHCQNTDLEKHLAKYYSGVMPQDIVRKVFLQIKKAFQVLRLHRIVHRDLKLANILVTEDFKIKIADFGFAGLLEDNMLFSSCVGTPLTMAPEVLDRKDYGEKCDIWSLGIILYQMLQGSTPFVSPENMTLQALKEGILNRKITFDPSKPLSENVKGLILKMIVNDPKQRMSFEEFFKHEWLREETCNISSCLREVVLQKELGNCISMEVGRFLDKAVIHRLLGHYKSNLENKLYVYIGLSKKLLSEKKSSRASAQYQRALLLGLTVLASNIKMIEDCQGAFVVNNSRIKIVGYNSLKDIEGLGQSEFSRSLPLLLKKSKGVLTEELLALQSEAPPFSNDVSSLSQCYLTSLVDSVLQGCCQSDMLQSLLKIRLHDQVVRVALSSETIPKQIMELVATPETLNRMSQPQSIYVEPEFSRALKTGMSMLKVEPRINIDPERQKLEQFYEAIKELL